MDTGLLIVRLVVGLAMAAHGAQKLFGWFGGYGLKGTGGFMESLGFHPGTVFAFAAASTEVTSGLLVALGLLGPIGPALMISVMIVAAGTVHWAQGFFVTSNGMEVPVLYGAVAAALAFTGFGNASLDAAFGLQHLWTTPIVGIILALGIVGGFANLSLRKVPAPAASHA